MKFLNFLFYIVIYGIAIISFLPHVFANFWLTDIFSHFKLQYVIILIFLLPITLYLSRKKILPAVLIVFIIIWNSWFIYPLYTQDHEISEISGISLSILSMNLLASNTNYSDALDLIREKDPDVVVLLELSPSWEAEFRELYSQFPFRQMYPQTNNFGIGILSKVPMVSRVTDFEKGFPPSILGEFQNQGEIISFLATHPYPPVSQEKFSSRNAQLYEIAKLSKGQERNFILMGDLNSSSYSRHFRDLLEQGELKDSRKGFGIASSWPSDIFIMRTTLDHILYKGDIRVITRTTEKSIGSDHLPVYMEIIL